jgi:sugar O-acyltransferase (sialic acid O-acetyltransferase NeuD family)
MKVVIIGAGSMARLVVDCLEFDRNFRIAGLIDDEKQDYSIKNYAVIGKKSDLPAIREKGEIEYAVIAVGDCDVKEKISYLLDECGYKLISCTHPTAVIASDVIMGGGIIIGAGVIIGTGAKLGNAVTIETGSIIGTDTVIGDNVSIKSGVTVAGGVVIGRNVSIKTGATIAGLLSIGKHNDIDVGEVVKADLTDKPVTL